MTETGFAICNWDNDDWEWSGLTYISPEQAALGAMTDGEVATILIRRKRHKDHDRQFAEGEDNLALKVADELGLWPPEVQA